MLIKKCSFCKTEFPENEMTLEIQCHKYTRTCKACAESKRKKANQYRVNGTTRAHMPESKRLAIVAALLVCAYLKYGVMPQNLDGNERKQSGGNITGSGRCMQRELNWIKQRLKEKFEPDLIPR